MERLGLAVFEDIRFWIPGRPVPKGRPRSWNGRMVTPKSTRDFEARIASACDRIDVPIPGSWDGVVLGVHICAVHKRTGRETAKIRRQLAIKARHRSDLDNIVKSTVDGIQRSRLMLDDSHVVSLDAWRMVAPFDSPKLEGVLIGVAFAKVIGC